MVEPQHRQTTVRTSIASSAPSWRDEIFANLMAAAEASVPAVFTFEGRWLRRRRWRRALVGAVQKSGRGVDEVWWRRRGREVDAAVMPEGELSTIQLFDDDM